MWPFTNSCGSLCIQAVRLEIETTETEMDRSAHVRKRDELAGIEARGPPGRREETLQLI
jgi:hypothetical protein